MRYQFPRIDLPGGYSVRETTWTDYRSACEAHEAAIFGPETMSNYDGPHSKDFTLCLGILASDELIGWHYSHEIDGDVLMRDTGILPAHQRQGIYSALLPSLLAYFKSCGFRRVRSRHEFENNPVLIAKLRNGFVITGTEIDKGVSYIKLTRILDA